MCAWEWGGMLGWCGHWAGGCVIMLPAYKQVLSLCVFLCLPVLLLPALPQNYTEASAAYEPIFSAATPEARKKTKFVWRSTTHARNAPNVGMSSMNNW